MPPLLCVGMDCIGQVPEKRIDEKVILNVWSAIFCGIYIAVSIQLLDRR